MDRDKDMHYTDEKVRRDDDLAENDEAHTETLGAGGAGGAATGAIVGGAVAGPPGALVGGAIGAAGGARLGDQAEEEVKEEGVKTPEEPRRY